MVVQEEGVVMKDKGFGERLKQLRKMRGLKQHEAAFKIGGISFRGYQNWENGHVPLAKNIEKLVNFYGCTKAFLLTGEGNPYLNTEEEDRKYVDMILGLPKAQMEDETDEEQRTGSPPFAGFAIYDCIKLLDEAMPPLKIFQDAPPGRSDAMKKIFRDFRKAIKNSGFTIDEKILDFINYLYYYYIQEDKSGSE